MYCTTCELEIKGDDKDTCPVCGAPLTDSHADDSALINQGQQEQPASDEIFKDPTSSEGPDSGTSPAGIAEEEAFVLKDYEPDFASTDGPSASSGGSEEPQLFEQPDVQQEVNAQPLMTESVQGDSGSVDDALDSIRESIATSESPVEEQPAAGGEPVGPDDDFAFFDSFDKDTSTDSPAENTADESAPISWGYDEAAAAVAMPDAPERKRSPVFKIALIVVFFVVGGYYFFTVTSDSDAPLVRGTSEAVVTTEPVIEDEVEIVESSSEAESDIPAVPGEAESVVFSEVAAAGEGEAVKPSTEAEPEAPVASESVTAPFFTVHVGSYRKRASAASEVARIKAKGYDAFIEHVDLGKKGVWYRVKVGRFKIRAEAEQLQEKIKKIPVTDTMVVTQRTN